MTCGYMQFLKDLFLHPEFLSVPLTVVDLHGFFPNKFAFKF